MIVNGFVAIFHSFGILGIYVVLYLNNCHKGETRNHIFYQKKYNKFPQKNL